MFIRAYLRASTDQQDAKRAQDELIKFALKKGERIASFYVETSSGAKIERPELSRLISDSHPGDILLIEKVDRLSRLPYEQWKRLKNQLVDAQVHIVVIDQPMTHGVISSAGEESTMISKVLTEFMIDLAAAMSRDDYETRRKRQAEGIKKAKEKGVYTGRQPDHHLRDNIRLLISERKTWTQVQKILGCSRSTISRALNEVKKSDISEQEGNDEDR